MARTAAHRIGIVVFDGVKLLDVAGPSEEVAARSVSERPERGMIQVTGDGARR